MTSALLLLLNLTAFFSGAEWFININIRIYLVEILALCFSSLWLFYAIKRGGSSKLPAGIRLIVGLYWARFFLATFSGLNLICDPMSTEAYSLFFKNEMWLLTLTVFLHCMAKFINDQPEGRVWPLLSWYLMGAVLSSCYGIMQPLVLDATGVDVDIVIWKFLGVDIPPTMGIMRQAYGSFYRIKGWSMEPNVLASYIVTALPLLMLPKICFAKFRIFFIFILGLAITLTMSLSGLLALSVAVLFLLITIAETRLKLIKTLVLIAIPIAILATYFPAEVHQLSQARLDSLGSSNEHFSLVSEAFNWFAERPWGYGLGSYSQIFEKVYGIEGFNAHSSWLTYLVEEGIQGAAVQLLILIVFIREALRRRCLESNVFIASYIGICAGGMFYNTLTIFLRCFTRCLCFRLLLRWEWGTRNRLGFPSYHVCKKGNSHVCRAIFFCLDCFVQ